MKNGFKNLKRLRENANISPLNLSNKIGVSRELIYKLENAETDGSVETLIKIADYFKVSTDYVLGKTKISLPIDKLATGLNEQETNMLNLYSRLNVDEKNIADGFIKGLLSSTNKKD